jgi:predicted nuclease of restriction endonuclease-like RecB superfamily
MDIEHGHGSEHKKEFVNKVAEKLGVSPEKVSAALQDVRKERIDQAITERIQEAVQNSSVKTGGHF